MRPWTAVLAAVAAMVAIFALPSWAGTHRQRVGPPGKGIHRPAEAASVPKPVPLVRPSQKIGPRRTIVPPWHRASGSQAAVLEDNGIVKPSYD
jgi:hypothetical protein